MINVHLFSKSSPQKSDPSRGPDFRSTPRLLFCRYKFQLFNMPEFIRDLNDIDPRGYSVEKATPLVNVLPFNDSPSGKIQNKDL